MPGKVGVKIKAGRNLPVMDRGSDTTDAYVEIKLGNVTHKTDVCRKSLNPQWNTDWYRFEVDDAELQDEPLQIRLMDHDTYSANDAIGKVNISLNPLCLENAGHLGQGKGAVMSGWIPVFDTMHGIRGEVNIIVKVDLFLDANKFRQSSCGVQFFHSPCIPHGYRAQVIHGFVEELVVNDDPEYQWIDKIRTPRASNEARQVVFLRLSGQVQRKIGLKAINLGANAVIGYTQCFDLEGDVGVVARGIGTAVTLAKIQEVLSQPNLDNALIEERTLKYLEFLKGNCSPDNIYRSKFDSDIFECRPHDRVYKILGIESTIEKAYTRTPNTILKKKWRPNQDNEVIIEEPLSENEGISNLLQQEDMRDSYKPQRFRRHVRRLTSTSRNILHERFKAFRNKMNEDKNFDNNLSVHSSYSDISYKESICSSFTDLRDFLRYKKRKINRSISDGSGMASLLVNSIIHGGPNLDLIAEGHDSARSTTPSGSIKSSKSIKSESMGNLSKSPRDKKFPNTIKLRQNPAVHISDASISTITISSSTTEEEAYTDDEDEDEEEEGQETTTSNDVIIDPDTVSMVVKSVLAQQDEKDARNWIEPGSTHDENDDDDHENEISPTSHKMKLQSSFFPAKQISTESGSRSDDSINITGKRFIPTGATKILKQGKNSKVTESKLVESSPSQQSYENILKSSLINDIDTDAENWIEPGSTIEEEPEVINNERRGSILQDIKDFSEKLCHLQEHIHLPHFTDDKNKYKENIEIPSVKKVEEENFEEIKDETHYNKKEPIINKSEKRKGNTKCLSIKLLSNLCSKSDIKNKNNLKDVEVKMKKGSKNELELEPHKEEIHINEQLLAVRKQNLQTSNDVQQIKIENDNLLKAQQTKLRPLKIPDISLTKVQYQTRSINSPEDIEVDGTYFYSSEPELIQATDTPITPNTLGQPFISLINLNVSNTSSLSSSMPNNYSTNSCPITPETFSCSSTLETIPITPETTIPQLSQPLFVDQNRNITIMKSLDNARNNMLSSSYTNLSTNKAPTLAPFPYLKHSRSELATNSVNAANAATVATGIVNTGIPTNPSSTAVTAAASVGNAGAATATTSVSSVAPVVNNTSNISKIITPAVTGATATTVITATIVGHIRAESVGCKITQSPAKVGNSIPICSSITSKDKDKDSAICRRSSDSDLNVTPKGNSICVASERLMTATNMMRLSANLKAPLQENLDMMEYPFLTMAKYPPGFILHIGATVTARSVKLLERVPNPDEPETRDSWWTEIRMEIRSHARSLGCNVILGYTEVTSISDEVCVLSATGTAAIINMSYNGDACQIELTSTSKKDLMVSSLDDKECLKDLKSTKEPFDNTTITTQMSTSLGGNVVSGKGSFLPPISSTLPPPINLGCSLCHIPYTKSSVPYNIKMKKCALCKRGKVPDVLLATIEIPDSLQITGRGCLIQAQVVRTKKDLRSESNAKEISDGLPFLEYELHRLLINKLKAKGMNAIFGLKAQIVVGEKMIALIATGTAVFLAALPPPIVPKIVAGNSWTDTAKLNEIQKSLQETFEKNREIYQLKIYDLDNPQQQQQQQSSGKQSDTDDSDDEVGELDLNTGNKDTCVLEIDDIEDLGIISLLMEPCPPEGFHVVNTQSVPGLEDMEVVKNLQMFCQVWRAKISIGQPLGQFPNHFQRLLQTIFFKLRSMIPCAICDLKFRLDLPESDEIQLLVTGMALGLGEPSKLSKLRRKNHQNNVNNTVTGDSSLNNEMVNGKKSQDEELMFSLDEDQNIEVVQNSTPPCNMNYGSHSLKLRKNSPQRSKFCSVKLGRHTPLRDRYGVDITPLSYVPGGKIEKYLGNLNFFFIRESTSIREIGGISGFVHSFITELLAVVRAHISALGGNAMVSFYKTELILVDNQHKNQGQCLISVGGDVVYVSYFSDD